MRMPIGASIIHGLDIGAAQSPLGGFWRIDKKSHTLRAWTFK
jgi:hypothetical protein